ncbi:rust resistance kinase Lr10-like [Hevea brasiliensis]|uniref:rust resistance kinase Lr10-like n=1 Tax=Hevea brasiliensis TaxID=3981 RepID=UPI0025D6BE57|nr:rust resistance kinase Lr10-like [Hevea brasiliensis]
MNSCQMDPLKCSFTPKRTEESKFLIGKHFIRFPLELLEALITCIVDVSQEFFILTLSLITFFLMKSYCATISDFGLAKLCPTVRSTISMPRARATIGYIAPEVYCRNIGGVSNKSDVYSYGMMVLEIFGERKNLNPRVENTSEIYFAHWIYKRIEQEEDLGLGKFNEAAEEETAKKMVLVGSWCIQTDPPIRPSISRVVEMLEGNCSALQMPPKPYLDSASSST